jgi:hypothetical protein
MAGFPGQEGREAAVLISASEPSYVTADAAVLDKRLKGSRRAHRVRRTPMTGRNVVMAVFRLGPINPGPPVGPAASRSRGQDWRSTSAACPTDFGPYHQETGEACSLAFDIWTQALLALGPSQGGHPIKVGRRKIIRKHLRTLRMQLRDAFADESGQRIAEMVLRL